MNKKFELLQSFPITNAMIRAMADPQSYNRGRNYQLGGAVSHGVRTTTGLNARVEGNYSPYYKVTITLTDSEDLIGNCTCPVGYGCKHCVAVCLEWLAHPIHFSQDGHIRGSGRSQDRQEQSRLMEIPKLTGIDVIALTSACNAEELRTNFLNLWNCIAPKAHGNLIPSDLPKITWMSTLDSIDYGSGESGGKEVVGYAVDYACDSIILDDPHPSFLQPNRKTSLVGRWFSPPELMHFFTDPATKKALLAEWIDSYCDLGTQVRDAFSERGILPPNAETLNEFYTEIYGDEKEREHEDSERNDYGWRRYDDYDDEFDPDDVSIEDLYPLANRFIKRVTPILRELAEYYCTLRQYGLDSEAQRFMTSALAWFVSDQDLILSKDDTKGKAFNDDEVGDDEEEDDDDLGHDADDGEDNDEENDIDIDENSLPDLEPIRVEIHGLLESAGLQNVTPEEKLDYYLNLLKRNLNQGNAELIRKALGQSDDSQQIAEYAIQKLTPMFEEKPQEILWTLIEQILEEYLPDSTPAILEITVPHLCQYPKPRSLLSSITSHLGSQSQTFIRKMQSAILNELLSHRKTGKKQGDARFFSDLYVQAVDWFVQYHQTHQNPQEALDLLAQFAQKKPKQVTYGHYKVAKKLAIGTNTGAAAEALQAFLSNIQGKGEPAEIALTLIDEDLLDLACESLQSVKNDRDEWKIIQKLATKIKRKTTLSDESFQTLKSLLHSLIQQWTRPDVRSRPDQDIAEGVALLKLLHELHNTQDQWEKWFAKFFQAHSRKHNLRAALKQKGLV